MIDNNFVYLVFFVSFFSFLWGILAERIVIALSRKLAQKKFKKMFGDNVKPLDSNFNQFIISDEKGNDEDDS